MKRKGSYCVYLTFKNVDTVARLHAVKQNVAHAHFV